MQLRCSYIALFFAVQQIQKKKSTRRHVAILPPQVRFASEYVYFGGFFDTEKSHLHRYWPRKLTTSLTIVCCMIKNVSPLSHMLLYLTTFESKEHQVAIENNVKKYTKIFLKKDENICGHHTLWCIGKHVTNYRIRCKRGNVNSEPLKFQTICVWF